LTLNTGHIKIDKAALVLFVLLCFIGCSGDLQSTKKDPILKMGYPGRHISGAFSGRYA